METGWSPEEVPLLEHGSETGQMALNRGAHPPRHCVLCIYFVCFLLFFFFNTCCAVYDGSIEVLLTILTLIIYTIILA